MIIYYITDFGRGSYCFGPDTDQFWINNKATSIIVPPKPHPSSFWDLELNRWNRTPESIKKHYCNDRIMDLRRSLVYKYLDTGLSVKEQKERDRYILSLENLTYDDVEGFVYPTCPEFMNF